MGPSLPGRHSSRINREVVGTFTDFWAPPWEPVGTLVQVLVVFAVFGVLDELGDFEHELGIRCEG